jgi:hypothetical protein
MKKMFVIVLAIVATTMFSSCKKDYTCKCNKVYTTSSGTVTNEDGSYVFKDNKAGANESCNDQERTGTDLGGDYSRQCDLD